MIEEKNGLLTLDGSSGEGGGQIVRTALSLSLITGRPFRVENVRAKRKRPGLMRQHLTAVEAAARVGCGHVEGAEVGARAFTFWPGTDSPGGVAPGDYRFAVGTAGSTTLVLQTLLPPLLLAEGPSTVRVIGGTHNPMAPPFDYLERSFLPAIRRMGADADLELVRHGFYPAGGGEVLATIRPSQLKPVEFLERGEVRRISACATVADLSQGIADREVDVIRRKLQLTSEHFTSKVVDNGPGNIATADVETDSITEVFVAFGKPGKPAEKVASEVVRGVRAYLRSEVPVGPHLADQLLIPMAMAGGGKFRTSLPTMHTQTNAKVVQAFLPVTIDIEEGEGAWLVTVAAATAG